MNEYMTSDIKWQKEIDRYRQIIRYLKCCKKKCPLIVQGKIEGQRGVGGKNLLVKNIREWAEFKGIGDLVHTDRQAYDNLIANIQ